MPETIWGYVDQYTTPEFLNTATGVFLGTLTHVFGESLADRYYKERYPEKYPVYSTLTVTALIGAVSLALFWYSRKRAGWEFAQYLIGGFLLVELVQILDLIRVQFFVRE